MAQAKPARATKKTAKKSPAKKSATKKSATKKSATKKTAKKSPAKKTATRTAKGTPSSAVAIVRRLRAHALALPDTVEEFPWDHSVVKVGKKVLIFLDRDDVVGKTVQFSVKLPHTAPIALTLPFAKPTGYGLGKAGWVSFAFGPADAPPIDVMNAWIDESFCAVAPKRTIAKWRAGASG